MAKFHITDDGPKTCTASIKECKYGGAATHFENIKDATTAYESSMASKYGEVSSVSKSDDGSTTKKRSPRLPNLDGKVISSTNSALNGKTISEYRDTLKNLHDNYYDKYPNGALNWEGITKSMGLNEDQYKDLMDSHDMSISYSVNDNGDVIVEITEEHSGDGVVYQGEYNYYQDDVDATDYDASPYYNLNGVISRDFIASGYYGSDNHMLYRYSVPEEFKEESIKIAQANENEKYYQRSQNPNLPDWAALPADAALDTKSNQYKFNKDIAANNKYARLWNPSNLSGKFNRPRQMSAMDLELKTNPPTARSARKYEQIINSEETINNLRTKINTNHNKIARNEKKIKDIEAVERTSRAADASRYEKMTKSRRSAEVAATRRDNDKLRRSIEDAEKKIGVLEKVTPTHVENARKQIAEIEKENAVKLKDWNIDRLSHFYPSVDEAKRKKAATEWVNAHPELANNKEKW